MNLRVTGKNETCFLPVALQCLIHSVYYGKEYDMIGGKPSLVK
jgi:hypothetical protein